MKKNTKDPYPISDVYHVSNTLVDGATVCVTDLCENLSNSFDTYVDNIEDQLKEVNIKKFNSISVGNGADGIYPVWVGVDKNSKVKKIFVELGAGSFLSNELGLAKNLVSWSWNKEDMNDQFFQNNKNKKSAKRIKLFDIDINSNAIATTDHGGNFFYEHHDAVVESLNEKYFKKKGVFQNNYPIGLYVFEFKEPNSDNSKKFSYTEYLSNLLNESLYPTKYLFEDYLEIKKDHDGNAELKIKDKKISADYLMKRLPRALKILEKQTNILFSDHKEEVYKIRKEQLENFIVSIIKLIEPQELDLPRFNNVKKEKKVNNFKLGIKSVGLTDIRDMLFFGYKFRNDPILRNTCIFPVTNKKYPCYLHIYPDATVSPEDDYELNYSKFVIEGIEGCYLNKNEDGNLILNKKFINSSPYIEHHIKKKSHSVIIDQIVLRNSENLDQLTKLSFIKELELIGLKHIKNWDGLSKLKNLKKLKLTSCEILSEQSENFLKNLYSLSNLEKFVIDDSCKLIFSNNLKFSKDIYPKKLKDYEIEFRNEFKNEKSKDYPDHQGYGSQDLDFLSHCLPNLYSFPNYENIKTLEKLRLYNFFDFENKEGKLFNYVYGFNLQYSKIHQLIRNSKLKDIWIYGYNFKGIDDLKETLFLENSTRMLGSANIKLNGINKDKYKQFIISQAIINTDTLVIIDDNCGYNKSKSIDDIQLFHKDYFTDEGYLQFNLQGEDLFHDLKIDNSTINDFFKDSDGDLFRYSKYASTLFKEINLNHFFDKNYNKDTLTEIFDSIVFVKKDYLDKNKKKELFSNVKHLYYYCVRNYNNKLETCPIFWNKKEKFSLPKSVNADQLETLHLSSGRTTCFKDIEKICGKTLKTLVIEDMLVSDFKAPKMPQLEKLVVNYGNYTTTLVSEYNDQTKNFRNFNNLPNLKELELDIELNGDYGIEIEDIDTFKNLQYLKITDLNPKYTNELTKVKSIENLDISLWDTKKKVTEKDFEFVKSLSNLKKVKLSAGYHASINVDYEQIINFLNKNLEELEIDVVYRENNHEVFYNCFNAIGNKFLNLKKLSIGNYSILIDSMERSKFSYDKKDFKFLKKKIGYFDKISNLKSNNFKYNLKIDFNHIKNLKKLNTLEIRPVYTFGVKVFNENKLMELKSLERVVINPRLFSNSFYRSVKNKNIRFGYGYYGKTVNEILDEISKK